MIVVFAFLAFGVVVAIAAVLVIREAGRIAGTPPPAIFDPDDAEAWVIEQLPAIAAATLTPNDVRRILGFQLEFFAQFDASLSVEDLPLDTPAVVGGLDEIAYIEKRAADTGEAYIPEQIEAVIETQLSYLRAIGAVGPTATPDENLPPT